MKAGRPLREPEMVVQRVRGTLGSCFIREERQFEQSLFVTGFKTRTGHKTYKSPLRYDLSSMLLNFSP